MRERRALRLPGRAARVLDVDRVVGVEARFARVQLREPAPSRRSAAAPSTARSPRPLPRSSPNVTTRSSAAQLGAHLGEHREIVGRLEARRGEQEAHARLAQRVAHLLRAIGGVHVDEDRADARGRELDHGPLGAVLRPDADAVAAPDAEAEQRECDALDLARELRVGPADRLVDARPVHRPTVGARPST